MTAAASGVGAETAAGANTAARIGELTTTLIIKLEHELFPDPVIVDMVDDIELTEEHRLLVVRTCVYGQVKLADTINCVDRKHTIMNLSGGLISVVPITGSDQINLELDGVEIPAGESWTFLAKSEHWFIIGK